MFDQTKPQLFFFGANTPKGFVSLFDQLDPQNGPWHTFIIKGGPGTGKSSFLKKIAAHFAPQCPQIEVVPCSSDPNSLDAVILPEYRVALADGTAPHTLEPSAPALRQSILSFGDYLNAPRLKENREELEALFAASPKCYRLAVDYFSAAYAFLADTRRIALSATSMEKVAAYAQRFAQKNFGRSKEEHPTEKVRFLTAVHAGGLTALEDTPKQLCRRLYQIHDEFGAVSPLLLGALRSCALEAGHSVITCYCPTDPYHKIEHLFLPNLGIGFVTVNRFHPMESLAPCHRIHAKRFMDMEMLRSRKGRLSFNRKAAQQLIAQTVNLLKESRIIHDKLESRYTAAMDFSFFEDAFQQVAEQINTYAKLF